MKKKVLVVDDERDIVELIRYNLSKEGFEVLTAYNGLEALERAAEGPDLILLDLMMPVLDGFETCKRLKASTSTGHIPVVFLTARSGEVDEIIGLELGADDYILKPISPRKLVARVKAVLRRREHGITGHAPGDIIHREGIEIDRSSYSVRLGNRDVAFPRKEFEILALMASRPGKVFSREKLLDAVWGSGVVVIDRTVDVHIRKIREKLGDQSGLIETVKGVGYRFRE